MSLAQLSLFNPENLTPIKTGDGGVQTLRSLFPDFELAKLSRAKQATITKYHDSLAHWRVSGLADIDVSRATTSDVLKFYRHLLAQPGRYGRARLSDSSIHFHLVRIRCLFRFACDRKHLMPFVPDFPEHPIDAAAKLKRYWVSREEIEAVLAGEACTKKRLPRVRVGGRELRPADWWRALVYLTWWCATRISESLELVWGDLEGDVLTIRPTRKRAKEPRYVVLDARCLELVAKLRSRDVDPNCRIFPGLADRANVSRHFKRLFAWAGIHLPAGSAWHSLRRGRCESEFLAGGREYAQRRLGHKDLATTEQHYLREAVERAKSVEEQRELLQRQSEVEDGRQKPAKHAKEVAVEFDVS
jgi:integrase